MRINEDVRVSRIAKSPPRWTTYLKLYLIKSMSSTVKIELTTSEQIMGSAPYTVSVAVTNTGISELMGVEVEPSLWAGRLLMAQAEVTEVEESELETRRRSIIKEMESQVVRAYERQALRKMSVLEKIAFAFITVTEAYVSIFSRKSPSGIIPGWTNQAFRVHDWQDVEMLEREIIAAEDDDSKLKKAFLIDKDKLSRCIEILSEKKAQTNEFESGISLAPGSSVTFPFSGRAPHLLRRRSADIQFKVMFRQGETKKVSTESVTQRVTLAPSAFAVPTGGMIGAMCGYGIRRSLETGGVAMSSESGWQLFGCVLLGLVVSLLVSRKPDSYKAITAEDFLGGFLLGALSGLFSEALLEKVRLLVPAKTVS